MLMGFIHSFLINLIYIFKSLVKKLTYVDDFTIVTECIEYDVDHTKSKDSDEPFWINERKVWDSDIDGYYADIDVADVINNPPECVKNILVRIKFWYGNKIYKYLTRDTEFKWPPKKKPGVSFHVPLKSAVLIDVSGKPVKDVLGKIIRYAGPHNDFYRNDIKIEDMFWYSRETYNEYPIIKLTNILGIVKSVKVVDGKLTDLQIP